MRNFENRSRRGASSLVGLLLVLGWLAGCGERADPEETGPQTSQLSAVAKDEERNVPSNDRRHEDAPQSAERTPRGLLPRFVSVTETAGINVRRYDDIRGEHRILESIGGGVGLFDYDRDGWLDVFFTNGCRLPLKARTGERTNRMYRNRDGERYSDVTDRAGVRYNGFCHGVAVGDYNGDGFGDFYVTAYGPNTLWRNNGDGTFSDVTAAAGTGCDRWSTSAAFADLNADGHLDLYVANYLLENDESPRLCPVNDAPDGYIQCPPDLFDADDDVAYLSDGRGGFHDLTRAAGFTGMNGKGLGVVVFDADRDGAPDVYVANDGTPNFLYFNTLTPPPSPQERPSASGGRQPPGETGRLTPAARQLTGRGAGGEGSSDSPGTPPSDEPPHLRVPRFIERGTEWGVSLNFQGLTEAGMGIACGDYDADGWTDLFLTHFWMETNTLYRNLQGRTFVDRTDIARLGPVSRWKVGWGTEFIDWDNNGWLDLIIVNGHVDNRRWMNEPWRMRPQVFRNEGDGTFRDVSRWAGGYFHRKWLGRGLAVADLDRDGRLDVVVSHQQDTPTVLHNQTPTQSKSVILQLVGRGDSNRSGIGAVVEAEGLLTAPPSPSGRGDESETRTLVREVHGGGSFQSASDRAVHIGLGEHSVLPRLRIRWPSGETDEWIDLHPGRYVAVEKRSLWTLPSK